MAFCFFSSFSYSYIFVQVGAFSKKEGAEVLSLELKKQGLPTLIYEQNNLHLVLVGNFTKREEALNQQKKIKALGYEGVIKEIKDIKEITLPPSASEIKSEIKEVPLDDFSLLQVGSFPVLDAARGLKEELEKKGYFSFIIYEIKNGDESYKVVVGQKEGTSFSETLNLLKTEYEVIILR